MANKQTRFKATRLGLFLVCVSFQIIFITFLEYIKNPYTSSSFKRFRIIASNSSLHRKLYEDD